jgi:hypothetical protein
VLLVDDEVEVVEVVFGGTCFFPGFFRKDTVKFCGDNQFLPRDGGSYGPVPKRDRPYTLKSFRVKQRHPFNAAGRSMSRSAAIWQSIRARTLH